MKKLIFFSIFMLFFLTLSSVKSVRKDCSGSIVLVLSPSSAESGTEIKAMAAGLTGDRCQHKTIYIRRGFCFGEDTCECKIVGSGCSCTFTAPLTEYILYARQRHYSSEYEYFACFDKNDNWDFSDPGEWAYTSLTVRRKLTPLPLAILDVLAKFFKNILGMFTQAFKLKWI